MQLNFLTDETNDVESSVNNIFTRVANGFDLKLFKLTPNKSKNKTIGYSIYLDTSLMAKINTDLTIISAHKRTMNKLIDTNNEKIKELSNPVGFLQYKCDEN